MSGDTWYMSELYRIYPQPFKQQPYQLPMIFAVLSHIYKRGSEIFKKLNMCHYHSRATTAIWTKSDLLLPSEGAAKIIPKTTQEKKLTNKKETYALQTLQTREKNIGSLTNRLPEQSVEKELERRDWAYWAPPAHHESSVQGSFFDTQKMWFPMTDPWDDCTVYLPTLGVEPKIRGKPPNHPF